MTIMSKNITEKLFEQQDLKYKDFTSTLMPGSRPVIGVRLPILRKMAKEIAKGDYKDNPENAYQIEIDITAEDGQVSYDNASLIYKGN